VTTIGCAAGRARPGELLSLVADGLTSLGLDVMQGEAGQLAIASPEARCALSVSDCGRTEWEYCLPSAATADVLVAADLATILLTGCLGPFPRLGDGRSNVTFKGLVAHELAARGMEVELAVYADEDAFDAFAEIVATGPGGCSQVHVSDDGGLTWIREAPAGASSTAGRRGPSATPGSIAAEVVEAVGWAMDYLQTSDHKHPASRTDTEMPQGKEP